MYFSSKPANHFEWQCVPAGWEAATNRWSFLLVLANLPELYRSSLAQTVEAHPDLAGGRRPLH